MSRRGTVVPMLLLLLGVATAACSGGGDEENDEELPDPGPSSGVDRASTLVGLPDADVETMCQWVAGRLRGWGERVTCESGDYVGSAPGLTQCVAAYGSVDSCSVTVGDLEDCVNAAVGGCSVLPDACRLLFECA